MREVPEQEGLFPDKSLTGEETGVLARALVVASFLEGEIRGGGFKRRQIHLHLILLNRECRLNNLSSDVTTGGGHRSTCPILLCEKRMKERYKGG